jgi:hypothetical protein
MLSISGRIGGEDGCKEKLCCEYVKVSACVDIVHLPPFEVSRSIPNRALLPSLSILPIVLGRKEQDYQLWRTT